MTPQHGHINAHPEVTRKQVGNRRGQVGTPEPSPPYTPTSYPPNPEVTRKQVGSPQPRSTSTKGPRRSPRSRWRGAAAQPGAQGSPPDIVRGRPA